MLSSLGSGVKPCEHNLTTAEIGARFDELTDQLASIVEEMVVLKTQLPYAFDRETVGEMIGDLGIAAEECLVLAHQFKHSADTEPSEEELPMPNVYVEKSEDD
jgi:hypothetical protein